MTRESRLPLHARLEKAGLIVVAVSFVALLCLLLVRRALHLTEREFYEAHPAGFVIVVVMGTAFTLALFVIVPLAVVLRRRAGLPPSDVAALRHPVAVPGIRHWLGQLAAATLVGAMIPLAFFWELRDAPGSLAGWVAGCAAAGLVAGLFLLSPRRFFGTIFLGLGLIITLVPAYREGVPVTSARDLGIKAAIGLLMAGLGVFLLGRPAKQAPSDVPPAEPGSEADERGLR